MRRTATARVLAATALAAVLFTGACTGTNGSDTTSPGASGVASNPAGGATGTGTPSGGSTATGSDKQVCADAEKLIADSSRKFTDELVKAVRSGGDQAAVSAVKTLFTEWASGLRREAGKAANPQLKSALEEYATGLEKVNGQISTAADLIKLGQLNTPEIQAANDRVAQICG